ncbi:hypothetical protein C8R44DRAFT_797453 [Mycena epipterygia]|nr:hypothetical protein C8R44DRAFT_797453 [Mycena epipterygia]
MKFSLICFSSVLAAILASQSVRAVDTFNCSMNANVNSRACADVSCAITGQYLAGQIVAFDCVDAGLQSVNGSAWWARDPLKDWVPVGDMLGVDGESCDTNLGLCASLPSSAPVPSGPTFVPFSGSSTATSTGKTSATSSAPPKSTPSSTPVSSDTPSSASSSSTGVASSSGVGVTAPVPSASINSVGSSVASSPPSSSSGTGTSSAIRLRLGHGTSFIALLAITARWI